MRPQAAGGAVTADVVLTPTPYTYRDHVEGVVTTTAYTTRVPGLLIRSIDGPDEDQDGTRWIVVHWQGEALQGHHDPGSHWQALAVTDQVGALAVDWSRPSADIKANGAPDGLWEALLLENLADHAAQVVFAVVQDSDSDPWQSHEAVADLLAAGWNPDALTARLTHAGSPVPPLAERLKPLLAALAPLDGRPPWCGQCLPAARQAADERGWLTPCRRCHLGRDASTQAGHEETR